MSLFMNRLFIYIYACVFYEVGNIFLNKSREPRILLSIARETSILNFQYRAHAKSAKKDLKFNAKALFPSAALKLLFDHFILARYSCKWKYVNSSERQEERRSFITLRKARAQPPPYSRRRGGSRLRKSVKVVEKRRRRLCLLLSFHLLLCIRS